MRRLVPVFIALASSSGCVDGFRGSNVEIDLSPFTPSQVSASATPRANELPSDVHFSLYAVQEDTAGGSEHLFLMQQFEIHKIVDLASPCFIDVGEHVPHPGLHVSQYATQIGIDTGIPDIRNPPANATEHQKIEAATAVQRMMNVEALGGDMGIKAVTSASTTTYPGIAPDCTPADNLIPPPTCTDDASNARRLSMCQAAWKADPTLWEGTDRVLTAPLAGTTYGLVVGQNPVNLAPVGGAQFFVEQALLDIDAYAIYWQTDGLTSPGTLLYTGTPTPTPTRGVSHVHMANPAFPGSTADLVIFADIGEDDVHF